MQLYIVYFGKRAHRSYAREHTDLKYCCCCCYYYDFFYFFIIIIVFIIVVLYWRAPEKSRRAHAAAAGPGLWKLCEQSRRQVRGLIDFRHPLSSRPLPRSAAATRARHHARVTLHRSRTLHAQPIAECIDSEKYAPVVASVPGSGCCGRVAL